MKKLITEEIVNPDFCNIAEADNYDSVNWHNTCYPWNSFVEKFRNPVKLNISQKEFFLLSDDEQKKLKNGVAYIGGELLQNGSRSKEKIANRSVVTLDFDKNAPSDFQTIIKTKCKFTYLLHTTIKHTIENPRFRLIIPVSKSIEAKVYKQLAQKIADIIGFTVDTLSLSEAHPMLYPKLTSDGLYIFELNEDVLLNPYDLLTDDTEETEETEELELIPQGERDSTITSRAYSLWKQGYGKNEILPLLIELNKRCNPPLKESVVIDKVNRLQKKDRGYLTSSKNKRIVEPEILTANKIIQTILPEPIWIIPGLISEGLSILAGKPKLGKSWMTLDFAVNVSRGEMVFGKIKVEKRGVLYLALEDTVRRMQTRLNVLGVKQLDDLNISLVWNKGQTAIEDLEKYLQDNPSTALIIIDTLQKVREATGNTKKGIYELDYEALTLLKSFADKYKLAVLCVHHVRKGASDDPLEMISGSTGLTGAADSLLVLTRGRSQADAVLYATGRDIDESEQALRFSNGKWQLLGDAKEYQQTGERIEVLAFLKKQTEAVSAKEIALALGKNSKAISFLLYKLCEENLITKYSYGKYLYNH